ncbi:uncharacterized protein [Nicotiana tomentosiformis]|uniref:uncharacterized protein n=1 Tax=Nicotiana tomentosiformis TaxID=4098 RepID=UPI00388CE944
MKKKKKDNEIKEPKREKNLVLKTNKNDSSGEDAGMAYLTKRFQKMVRKNGGIPKRGSSSKPRGYDLCHKCGKPGHFIKDCPILKQDQYKHNTDKAVKRNQVPDKKFKRKDTDDSVVKQALAAWGDSSSESGDDDDQGDSSMMAVESEAAEYDFIFALMAKSDEDEEDDDEDENRRDDLVVVAVDLRETIESLKREKDILTKRIANIEHERDDLLVVVIDLKEIIEELRRESRPMNTQKGKEVASEEDLGRVKSDLEKSLKWTWSSDAITAMYTNKGVGEGGQAGNWETYKVRFQSQQKNKVFAEKVTIAKKPAPSSNKRGAMKGSNQRWYIDSGCSKHMTGSTNDFLSVKALQGGSVSFGNGKKGYILGVGRIGKSPTHSIENVYYVNARKYSLLSVSQICDKGNKVEFVSKICTVTNLVTGDVILMAKIYKNIYVADFESLHNGDLTCLSAVDDDTKLWHRRLGHASFTWLNKLVRKDLVRGLPKSSFKDHKVCDACAKGIDYDETFTPVT